MFFEWISKVGDKPPMFGLFHIVCLVVILLLSLLVIFALKNISVKKYKVILFISWIILVILEVIKEYGATYRNEMEYPWYVFPFQLCSMIFYVTPLIVFINPDRGKATKYIYDASIAFFSTYLFMGGLVTVINADTILSTVVYNSVHSMIHHGAQVVLGILTMVVYRKEFDNKMFLKGISLFLFLVGIAFMMNEVFHSIYPDNLRFNMFYISRFNHPPGITDIIFNNVPYIVYLLIYLLGFTLSAYISYIVFKAIVNRKGKRE